MSVGQVLESDSDEPPNIRTFLSLLALVLMSPGSNASPNLTPPNPYLARITIQPGTVNTQMTKTNPSDQYSKQDQACLSIVLTTPLDIVLHQVVLGIFSDHWCHSSAVAQIPLNLTAAKQETIVDTRVINVPLFLPIETLVSRHRTVSLCLKVDYKRPGQKVVSTGWRLHYEGVTLPPSSDSSLVKLGQEAKKVEEETSLNLEEIKYQSLFDTNSIEGNDESLEVLQRQKRQEQADPSGKVVDNERDLTVMVLAMLLSDTSSKKKYNDMGIIYATDKNTIDLHLIGFNLNLAETVKFTTANNTQGGECKGAHGESHFQSSEFDMEYQEDHLGFAKVKIPGGLDYHPNSPTYYLCVKDKNTGEYIHQGPHNQLQIEMTTLFMPIWLMIVLCCLLLCLSGLFSGLNLGLMSLDQTELKIVMSTGTEMEKNYANAILPVRALGNFLLCSILLGNVLVNNTLTIFLDTLTGGGGTTAVIGATLGIVIFGEIIPQAICSRHGLAVGAKTIILTKFFMAITSPLSFPISKILDCLLGAELGTVYNKERLMELLRVTDQYNDLEGDEVKIVTGALVLKQKSVKDIMTHLDDCYMLPIETLLNFETVSEIKDQGYSRIPVYDGERTNIAHILFAKDLLFIDPDDEKPIEEVCKFYKNEVNFVYQDNILTDMFDEFKSGDKGHMAVVQEVNNEGDGDPYLETVGLVTIEDIIEEIIQQEIIDETDVIIDNKSKKKRKRERYKKDADFKMFLGSKTHHRVIISPQMSLAILQFLTTSVRAFSQENCSRRILQKLLSMDVYRELKLHSKIHKVNNNNNKDAKDMTIDENEGVLMTKGKSCDFFVLIIEGRVEVTIGKEEHKFQEGPFSCFGEQMLEQALMIPSSPMPQWNGTSRGTTHSVSMHSSVNQEAKSSSNNLRKTARETHQTQHLSSEGIGKRTSSADGNLPVPQNKTQSWNSYADGTLPVAQTKTPPWIPDYTLRALTDVLYLKVRKNTYMVAIKASRMNNMNSDSGGLNMKDEDIDDVLVKVTENDADFTGNIMSPDKSWNGGMVQSMAGTPTDFRRESIRSSLSMMKAKFFGGQLMGRSNTSIDRSHKDEFWDGMANPALTRSGEDLSELGSNLNSAQNGHIVPGDQGHGPVSLPMNNVKKELHRDISDPTTCGTLPDIEGRVPQITEPGVAVVGSNATTVISVRGSGAAAQDDSKGAKTGNSPGDRTSLLQAEHPVS
eukprot:GFUD01014935.1.p1 GENE.GFUD01014935.1~~GFUD01014935.1.p1  ORF type:complete len:1247 (-),score=280.78 GFUD01014935.1:597-4241(-)